MMIPGSNLLQQALSVIQPTQLQYYAFKSRDVNNVGIEISDYEEPITLNGSFQPVPFRLFAQYGLEFNRSYYMFYASANMLNLNRDRANDVLTYHGRKYEVVDPTRWYAIDGWNGIMCVDVGVDDL